MNRKILLSAALVIAFTAGGVILVNDNGLRADGPAPAGGESKTSTSKSESSSKSDSGRDPRKGGDKGAGDKKDEGKGKEAADAAGDWKEPKIEKLPDTDKKGTKSLKDAHDAVYSARGKGMKKFASEGTLTSESPMGNMSIDLRLAWVKGEALKMNVVEPEEDDGSNPMSGMARQMLKRNSTKFKPVMDLMIGWEPFDTEFKDTAVVSERKADKLEEIRVWRKDGEGFASTLYTLLDGQITRIRDKESDTSFTYAKKDGAQVYDKCTAIREVPKSTQPGMPSGKSTSEFTFNERKKVETYTVATKVTTVVSVMNMKINVVLELTKPAADDKVTQAMIDAATSKDEEAPAADKPGEKKDDKKDPAKKDEKKDDKKDIKKPAGKDAGKSADGKDAGKKDPAKKE
jgi:hypothetical protein